MNLAYWYGAMIVFTLFFGFTISDDAHFPLVYVGLVAIMLIRALLACIFCTTLVEGAMKRETAPVLNDIVEPTIEMVGHINDIKTN